MRVPPPRGAHTLAYMDRSHLVFPLVTVIALATACDEQSSSASPNEPAGSMGGKQDGFEQDSLDPLPARALPELFDVDRVEPDDVLNVRALPSSDGALVGSLAPDATDVEVVAVDATGTWGYVNGVAEDGGGWVSMAFLRQQDSVWDGGNLPPSIICLGAEPFWGFELDGRTLQFHAPENSTELDIDEVHIPSGFASAAPHRLVDASNAEGQRALVSVSPAVCNDGSSDDVLGLSVSVHYTSGSEQVVYGGCCSIQP